jgi:hypothetical protein
MATDSTVVGKVFAEAIIGGTGGFVYSARVNKVFAEAVAAAQGFVTGVQANKTYVEVIASANNFPPAILAAPQENNPAAANPFLANPPVVQVVRHVASTGTPADPQTLQRYFARAIQPRVYPQRLTGQHIARKFPNVTVGNKKTSY